MSNGDRDASQLRPGVSKLSISSVNVARYRYLGAGTTVGIDYAEAAVYQRRYGTTSGSYPDLDRFGRVIASRWTKDLATDMDFVSVSVGYDENSNPLTTEENIFDTGFDVKYAIDGLDRVTDADEGTLSGGNITSQTRRQQWTLSQTGNWDAETLDLNGAASGYGTNGRTETRTHNLVNELTARSVTTDGGGPTTKNLVYDAAGNLTDDGETYAYEYDAWHRLRKIKDRGTSAVVSEHQYYGNGFRSGERSDADADGDIDANDPWYWFAMDERWRIVGTFRASDTSPKERFVHHTAGAGGYGTSSYIDQVVLRERDANTSWTAASDGTLEERLYYCQNWRHDVVALVTANGELRERVRYTSYGIPFGKPLGDCDGDGDVDAADQAILLGAWGTNTPKCDLNLDGTINATDQSTQLGNIGVTSGFAELTRNRNRLGYAGYAADSESPERWHVRHRTLESKLGRWTERSLFAYLEGAGLYIVLMQSPLATIDSYGTHAVRFVLEPSGCKVGETRNTYIPFSCVHQVGVCIFDWIYIDVPGVRYCRREYRCVMRIGIPALGWRVTDTGDCGECQDAANPLPPPDYSTPGSESGQAKCVHFIKNPTRWNCMECCDEVTSIPGIPVPGLPGVEIPPFLPPGSVPALPVIPTIEYSQAACYAFCARTYP